MLLYLHTHTYVRKQHHSLTTDRPKQIEIYIRLTILHFNGEEEEFTDFFGLLIFWVLYYLMNQG